MSTSVNIIISTNQDILIFYLQPDAEPISFLPKACWQEVQE
jgi:hypothetical protein